MLIKKEKSRIETIIDPDTKYDSFEEFQRKEPSHTLAIEGPVKDVTRFDISKYGVHGNINHHEGVDRRITLSACGQGRDFIIIGLFDKIYQKNGLTEIKVKIKGFDEDSGTTAFILENMDLVKKGDRRLDAIITAEGKKDRFVGAYKIDKKLLGIIGHVYEDYNLARFNGTLYTMNAKDLEKLMHNMHGRMMKYVEGSDESVILNGGYEELAREKNLIMVKEKNHNARLTVYDELREKDVDLGISIIRQTEEGKHIYTIRVVNDFLGVYDLNQLSRLLNRVDPGWGGGNYVIGPGNGGSSIRPAPIFSLVKEWMSDVKKRYELEKGIKLDF